jgi:hypothetical protein
MNKVWLGAGVMCILLLTGCNDQTPLTPGDPADPSFQSFQEGYSSVDGATNDMSQTAFNVIGDVLQGGTAKPTPQGLTYTLEYNEAAAFWVAHLLLTGDDGSVAAFTDSVQFLSNGHPVRLPVLATLDLVRSFLTVDLSGPQGTATGSQTLTLAPTVQDTTVLVNVNGAGHLEGTFHHSETDTSGTTDCTVDAAFSSTFSQVLLNITDGNANHCPLSGMVTHSGSLHVLCTGAKALEHQGHWTVTTTWENGVANVTCASGDNFWHYTASCGG